MEEKSCTLNTTILWMLRLQRSMKRYVNNYSKSIISLVWLDSETLTFPHHGTEGGRNVRHTHNGREIMLINYNYFYWINPFHDVIERMKDEFISDSLEYFMSLECSQPRNFVYSFYATTRANASSIKNRFHTMINYDIGASELLSTVSSLHSFFVLSYKCLYFLIFFVPGFTRISFFARIRIWKL